MKILILFLLPLTCFSQCPEDLWKRAILIGDEPMEVQIGKDQHMVLIVFERKDASKVETWVVSQKGTTVPVPDPKPDLVTAIDNLPAAGVTYSPSTNLGLNVFNANGWYHFQSTAVITWPNPAYNKSFSVLMVPGYVEIDITGYKFELFSEKRLNHGIAAVSVDGVKVADVDLYDPRTDNNSLLVYTWEDPSKANKAHKVRMTFTGNKNPAATENNIIFDYVKVYRKQ